MRGTGCSGGAFNYFEPLQNLDGYDVIETVAHQPWVLHHKVGMIGISYGGISQLFTAATDPPDLAAIAPLSVIDNTATTLYPGGILNTGFALPWAEDRDHDALPAAPNKGEAWALKRIQDGDATCKANQVLHQQAISDVAMARANKHYVPAVADPLSPVTFVHKIKVPVYLACQFTDEQTGGHCPDLAEHFTGTAHKWFTFTNGVHVDSLDPATFTRWYDFLELFVAAPAPEPVARGQAAGADDLLDRDGDRRHRPPERSDPEPADLRRGAQRVREAAAGAGAVRQRRGRRAGNAGARVRALFLTLPGPGDRGPLVVPGTERIARERTAGPGRAANVCLEQARRPRDRLHRRYRRRRALGRRPRPTTGPRTRPAPRSRT